MQGLLKFLGNGFDGILAVGVGMWGGLGIALVEGAGMEDAACGGCEGLHEGMEREGMWWFCMEGEKEVFMV